MPYQLMLVVQYSQCLITWATGHGLLLYAGVCAALFRRWVSGRTM